MGAGQGGLNCFSAGKLVRRKMKMTQFLLFDLSGKRVNSMKVENLMETSKLLQVSYLFVQKCIFLFHLKQWSPQPRLSDLNFKSILAANTNE